MIMACDERRAIICEFLKRPLEENDKEEEKHGGKINMAGDVTRLFVLSPDLRSSILLLIIILWSHSVLWSPPPPPLFFLFFMSDIWMMSVDDNQGMVATFRRELHR